MLQDVATIATAPADGSPPAEAGVRPPAGPITGVFPGFLEALGLHGLGALELPLLASLAGGEPMLLVGTHGSAKTALVRSLCEVMGLRFHAYDASKALFEDVLGFPNPASLSAGRIEYVPGPLSIWDKQAILVDELSRATPSMQNKWLEVVRARSIMGLSVRGLRHVFAAMNPPDYLGAGPLDPALAGRFAWVVRVPDVGSMREGDVLRIIRATTSEDAPLLPRAAANQAPSDVGRALAAFVAAVRGRYPALEAARGEAVAGYVHEVALALRAAGVALDGRRLGMLQRNLLLGLAVREVAGHRDVDLDGPVREVLRASLPHAAGDEPVDESALYGAHAGAFRVAFEEGQVRRRTVTAILGEADPGRAVDLYVESAHELTVDEHDRVVERFLGPARDARGSERPEVYARALRLAQAVLRAHGRFPPELVARLAGWAVRVTGVSSCWITALDLETEDQPQRPMHTPAGALSTRLGLELTRTTPGDPDDRADGSQAEQLSRLADKELRRLERGAES